MGARASEISAAASSFQQLFSRGNEWTYAQLRRKTCGSLVEALCIKR
jgi:hypothetical protein